MLSAEYIKRQIKNLLPEDEFELDLIDIYLPIAIDKTEECISTVINYREEGFNYLNSSQYATFLYFLANSIYIKSGNQRVPEKLFLLNKMISGIDLWYKIKMPNYFSVSHTLGTVFSNSTYGNYSVFFQGCTVGKNNNDYPVLSEGLIMFPGSVIAGKCNIGENTVVSSGVRIIDQDTPENCIVFQGIGNELVIKKSSEYYADRYFKRKERVKFS